MQSMNKCEELSLFKKTKGLASILMDIQPKLTSSLDETKMELLLDSLEIFIDSMTCFSIPVVVTEQAPEKLGGSLHQIAEKLPQCTLFKKNTFSAFGEHSFCEWVAGNNINHLLLSGIETSICIYLTALDALKKGLGVTIISDCVLSRRDADAGTALNELSKAGASILSLETILYSLMGSSNHPKFKEICSLVKSREEV
jgi:nicotinamidase-related amidase